MSFQKIINKVNNKQELTNSFKDLHPHVSEVFEECCRAVFSEDQIPNDTHKFKIEYVSNYLHDHLHTGDWQDVPLYKRQAFFSVSFIQAALIVKSCDNRDSIKEAIKCIDRGFLLGIPSKDDKDLLTQCASCLTESLMAREQCNRERIEDELPCKRLKIDCNNDKFTSCKNGDASCRRLGGYKIDVMKVLSLEEFYKSYFLPEKPVIIQGCMSHWPACSKWLNVEYLLQQAGERTVPIEIGSSYSDENFSQKLMTLREFIEKYYLQKSQDLGYLAQHDLLNQVPELKRDIRIPEFCCTSRNFDDDNLFEPEINAWFGPEGTVSSLHHDPKDNLLCQVFGIKQIILFAPTDSEFLYAHTETLLNNTAQVDPITPDLSKYPDYKKATMYSCVLNPSEMLYIPPKWWHHVTALQRSFSVNFWWQ